MIARPKYYAHNNNTRNGRYTVRTLTATESIVKSVIEFGWSTKKNRYNFVKTRRSTCLPSEHGRLRDERNYAKLVSDVCQSYFATNRSLSRNDVFISIVVLPVTRDNRRRTANTLKLNADISRSIRFPSIIRNRRANNVIVRFYTSIVTNTAPFVRQ